MSNHFYENIPLSVVGTNLPKYNFFFFFQACVNWSMIKLNGSLDVFV